MAGDSVLAVLLGLFDLLLFAADGLAELPELPPWYVALPVNIAMVAPLVFRRKSPLWSAYVVLVISIVHATLMLGIASIAGLAMSIYSVVVYAGRRQGLVFVGAVIVASAVQLAFDPTDELLISALFLAFGIALCWTLGEFVGARRAYDVEVEARLHLLETERDQATRIAVAEERGRIARELHDVVAHAVSVMVVQADGASYALQSNPELAQRALQTISETGRGALGELRRLLDVLRSDDADGEPRVPQPDAHALADLAERMRAAGVPVELELGELGELPAGVSLGVYRIVQESLTNTLKHAGRGATASVRVHRTGDLVEVLVSDDGAGRVPQLAGPGPGRLPGGNGLIGMRERAHVYGGTLEVGPAPGSGWQVRAALPVRLDK
ncbi:MAG TPA: histidine kinase [Amycolatopsis sp.]|uniref:histidine kinase n=2 Tax=Pseudonocardiaceae TaxID=2070 RepID=A0ABY8Y2C9_9PSEU|nr:histidine kinase [Amycolatopsis sp. 2-2]WIV62013.1 histidine kinase [Amycolatopsis sp. 2-2]